LKRLVRILFLYLIAVGLLSCTKDNSSGVEEEVGQLEIQYGSFGGFCAYKDSLNINDNLDLYFEILDSCRDLQFVSESKITDTEFAELVDLISFSEFQQLSLNSCDRCLDGLDTYLRIRDKNMSHRIVFGFNDDVSVIQGLIDRLNAIREMQR